MALENHADGQSFAVFSLIYATSYHIILCISLLLHMKTPHELESCQTPKGAQTDFCASKKVRTTCFVFRHASLDDKLYHLKRALIAYAIKPPGHLCFVTLVLCCYRLGRGPRLLYGTTQFFIRTGANRALRNVQVSSFE